MTPAELELTGLVVLFGRVYHWERVDGRLSLRPGPPPPPPELEENG